MPRSVVLEHHATHLHWDFRLEWDSVLKFLLHGRRLSGEFSLVRLKKGRGSEWLLIRKKDEPDQSSWDTRKSKKAG